MGDPMDLDSPTRGMKRKADDAVSILGQEKHQVN